MCGIVGLFFRNPAENVGPALVSRMAEAVRHRGPDGHGIHVEPGLAFGHRRLSIVDLAGGAQPMLTPDRSIVLIFNGEIYNHAVLRDELRAAGHQFRTCSDTEVILFGWREWGLKCLDRLDGMFAFALWDRDRAELLLARDRLGEKPLYHATLPDGTVAFASEPGALLAIPDLDRRLDPASVDDYFALGYVPDPGTIHAAIRSLPPAHYALLQRGSGAPSIIPRRYWRLPTKASTASADVAAELAERLRRSVTSRLMADVPLGTFLSGGVDSSAVTAFAAAATDQPLATFTIGFPGPADETPMAARVAARYGTRHRAEPAQLDYFAAARGQAALFGGPFGDHSSVPTRAVCALARRHVTVALSGDGGDEVFAGYRRYRWHTLAEGVRRFVPGRLRRDVVGRLAHAYPKLDRAPRWLRAKHTLTEISLDSALGYYRTVCKVQDDRRRGLFSTAMRSTLDGYAPSARFGALMAECDPEDALLQAQYADLQTYLPGDILAKVDRTSMSVSLEVRPPLLDPALVAWGMALPARLKLRGGVGKQVLRQAMAPHLPPDLLRGPKQGFAASIGDGFRAGATVLRERLLSPAMVDCGIFHPMALAQLADEHVAGHADHAQTLWQLLVFEGFLIGREAAAASAPADDMLVLTE